MGRAAEKIPILIPLQVGDVIAVEQCAELGEHRVVSLGVGQVEHELVAPRLG